MGLILYLHKPVMLRFLERLFRMDKRLSSNWKMFSTSRREVSELLVDLGEVTIGDDFLKIENYPFAPSIAFRRAIFHPDQIDDIDFNASPPTFRINNELIFLTAEKRSEIENFARRNNIKTVERRDVWGWILEPFLDTEFMPETDKRCTLFLENYGLTVDQVRNLREEVGVQMLKYNFDTMLWDWCHLGIDDVLRAMRTKYNKDRFADFYKRAMVIALLTPKTGD